MNRRNALKNLSLITGGMLLFPSCDFSDEKVSIILNKLQIDSTQESLLKSIVDTIIPEGKIPGGITAKSHNFVWAYIDNCVSKTDQNDFIKGLNDFMKKSNRTLGKKFAVYDYNIRLQFVLDSMENKDDMSINSFLDVTKRLSIWCYMNSEYILTKEMPYKLVPGAGSYKTCKTIDPNQKININA